MGTKDVLFALGLCGAAGLASGCEMPSFIDHARGDRPRSIEVVLYDGESLGDNPGVLNEEDWIALEGTDYARQILEFSERSGVVRSREEGRSINFGPGANLFTHVLDFGEGVDFSDATPVGTDADGNKMYLSTPGIPVNVLGEQYTMTAVRFNDRSEMRVTLESDSGPDHYIIFYDNMTEVTSDESDAYSPRHSVVDGVELRHADVRMDADMGRRRLFRIRYRDQNFPNASDEVDIYAGESAREHISHVRLLSPHFDICNILEGREGCGENPEGHTLIVRDSYEN